MDKPITLSGNIARVAALDTTRSPSGRRFSAVYPALLTGSTEEEAYIARQVRRDREMNHCG